MSLRLLENAPLAGLNTFGVAARARRLVMLEDERDLPQALAALADGPRLVLGAGSNVLFAGDFDGTILLMRTRGRQVLGDGHGAPFTRIAVAAGESWDETVTWTLEEGLAGLENLAMIPGTCGAAAIQNIGAYGVELCDRFDSLRAVDMDSGEAREFDLPDCRFDYRDSLFKQAGGRHWLILTLRLRVGAGHRPVLQYGELASALAAHLSPRAALALMTRRIFWSRSCARSCRTRRGLRIWKRRRIVSRLRCGAVSMSRYSVITMWMAPALAR